jgi:hypothetical protein
MIGTTVVVLGTILPMFAVAIVIKPYVEEFKKGFQAGWEMDNPPQTQVVAPVSRSAFVPRSSIPGWMPLSAYNLQRPAEPTSIRCSYKMEHTNYEEWYKIVATDLAPFTVLYCGVRRDSPMGMRLYEIMKDGAHHTMTLKLRYFSREVKPKLDFLNLEAEITEIVSER